MTDQPSLLAGPDEGPETVDDAFHRWAERVIARSSLNLSVWYREHAASRDYLMGRLAAEIAGALRSAHRMGAAGESPAVVKVVHGATKEGT